MSVGGLLGSLADFSHEHLDTSFDTPVGTIDLFKLTPIYWMTGQTPATMFDGAVSAANELHNQWEMAGDATRGGDLSDQLIVTGVLAISETVGAIAAREAIDGEEFYSGEELSTIQRVMKGASRS
ncbi:MAG: hypothetical protein R3B90_12575 [Planctomycetaceae bacterium]